MKDWSRSADAYRGTLYMLPDRGYNISGTSDYRARLNKVTFTLKPSAEGRQSLELKLADTILQTDAAAGRDRCNQHDAEAIVRLDDGSFFISDEYGPSIDASPPMAG